MSIVVTGLTKRFGDFRAVDRVDLEIRSGELIALLGPSGSGKTTLLRMIGGLEFADDGGIAIDGQDATATAPAARRVGFVFQHYALFRHMTVFENVAFGLRVGRRKPKLPEAVIREKVHRLLGLVQLEGYAGRYPGQLSGGQRQRVALARALATEPRVLLLDEPFGALDAKVRKELRAWLRGLHDEMGVTTVFVTHDQEEALELADRVVILNRGRVEQVGTPEEVYDAPASPFVCDFLGATNRLDCMLVDGAAEILGIRVALPDAEPEHGRALLRSDGVPAVAYIRPEDIDVLPVQAPAAVAARLAAIRSIGGQARAILDVDGHRLEAVLDRRHLGDLPTTPGRPVGLRIAQAHVFPQLKAT